VSLGRPRSRVALLAGAGVALGLPRAALAHAFAQRYDLPVPLLVLMVGYTMVSLWILAQPIVETGAGG
jgi:hypothetical protein